MARNPRRGVGYFPFDVDFFADEKTRILKGEFGLKGISAVVALLCEIYGDAGYYKIFGDVQLALLAESLGSEMSPGSLRELLNGCLRCGFFDKAVYETFGVLTSAGIQRRYLRAAAKRGSITIIEEYWLLDIDSDDDVPASIRPGIVFAKISGTGKGVSGTRNAEISTGNAQRKEKKRKEEKREVFAEYAGNDDFLRQALEEFAQQRREMHKPLTETMMRHTCSKLDRLAEESGATDRARYKWCCVRQTLENGWQGFFPVQDYAEEPDAPVVRRLEEPDAPQDFGDLGDVF